MVDPVWVMNSCRQTILSLVSISTPGWTNRGVTCTQSAAVTSWSRSFGRLSWIEMSLNYSGLTFANKTIDDNARNVTVSIPFQSVRKVKSAPKKSEAELRNLINDLFQALNLSISLGKGQVKTGNKVYKYLTFRINSTYDPEIWERMLTKFSGLTVNNIRYNNGTWNYEGTIYVQ